MEPEKARYYDGQPYARWIDPLLKPIRNAIFDLIEPGSVAVDIGCGTGALAMNLSKRCEKVIGIDHSPLMIRQAHRISAERSIDNLRLICGDALSALNRLEEPRVDCAVFSMMLHEIVPESRLELILRARRIAGRILFADYRIPLRHPLSIPILIIERMAGWEHFGNFLNFSRTQGLFPLIQAANLIVSFKKTIYGGNICILKTHTPDIENRSQSV